MKRSVDEHAALIEGLLAPVLAARAIESVELRQALGRVAATDAVSPVDLPLFRNSQMDGYAAHASDLAAVPAVLPVAAAIPAGPGRPAPLAPGTVAKIMTGAVLPEGADTVVPVEDTNGGTESVAIRVGRSVGEYVRDRGSDVTAGTVLVSAGTRLSSRHLAALAAAGIPKVDVLAQLRVAILTTGEELVDPTEGAADQLQPGQIFDANRIALDAACREAYAVVVLSERVSDEPTAFAAALDAAVEAADLVITSGGISQGDYEVVRQVLGPQGADVVEIAMQPGGPQATTVVGSTPVFSFPGNPVSTQISFAVFLRPLLRRAAGRGAQDSVVARLGSPLKSIPGKRQFRRGKLHSNGTVDVVAGPSSHLVAAMANADVLIDIPADTTVLEPGDEVRVVPL